MVIDESNERTLHTDILFDQKDIVRFRKDLKLSSVVQRWTKSSLSI
jgi:hypothetical protein